MMSGHLLLAQSEWHAMSDATPPAVGNGVAVRLSGCAIGAARSTQTVSRHPADQATITQATGLTALSLSQADRTGKLSRSLPYGKVNAELGHLAIERRPPHTKHARGAQAIAASLLQGRFDGRARQRIDPGPPRARPVAGDFRR